MGTGASTLNIQIKRYILNEYERVKKTNYNNINIDNNIDIKSPLSNNSTSIDILSPILEKEKGKENEKDFILIDKETEEKNNIINNKIDKHELSININNISALNNNIKNKEFLTLDEMFLLQHPPIIPIDFTHLGTLFIINKNLDGKFILSDLYTFGEFCDSKRKLYEPHEFLIKIQALCTYSMWTTCIQSGSDIVERWLFNCVYLNGTVKRFENIKDCAFIHRDSILPLYKLLRIDRAYSISFHDFFDLMQNAGEENCGFDMMDEEFDDLVPETIVMYFIKTVLGGFNQMMHDVGS